jgi:hypothetical protein
MGLPSHQPQSQSQILNQFLLISCLLAITSSACSSGQVSVSGTCQAVNYIEGCLTYKSAT